MKPFLEVFPDLHIADSVRGLLELVQVERVSAARDRSSIRIYIDSPRLMHKQNIYKLEEGIREQLFPGKRITVKIVEKYHLSEQYTPERLLELYRDSIQLELGRCSALLANLFHRAECSFDQEGGMTLALADSMVARERGPELQRILEKVFTERCGLPLEIRE